MLFRSPTPLESFFGTCVGRGELALAEHLLSRNADIVPPDHVATVRRTMAARAAVLDVREEPSRPRRALLALAALYESWSIPFAVMLSVPVGIFGALALALLFGQTNDVYFKVGLLTTIGLSAKNAILIVEFALEREAAGEGLIEATLQAAKQRLRPILMTSLAFILGVAPLATASGAGSGAQNSVGIGVLGGMTAATVLGLFFVPLLYVTVRAVFPGRRRTTSEVSPV